MLDVLEVHPGSFLRYGAYRHGVPLQFERVVDALEDTAHTRCGLYDDQRGEEVAAGHRALSCPDQLLPPAGVDGKRSWAVSPGTSPTRASTPRQRSASACRSASRANRPRMP